jgi:hypothetical protein
MSLATTNSFHQISDHMFRPPSACILFPDGADPALRVDFHSPAVRLLVFIYVGAGHNKADQERYRVHII